MLTVTWVQTDWRKGAGKVNPLCPKGIEVDVSGGAKHTCSAELPYPAPCIGYYLVVCERCGLKVGVTAASRVDDPRSIRVACKPRKKEH